MLCYMNWTGFAAASSTYSVATANLLCGSQQCATWTMHSQNVTTSLNAFGALEQEHGLRGLTRERSFNGEQEIHSVQEILAIAD